MNKRRRFKAKRRRYAARRTAIGRAVTRNIWFARDAFAIMSDAIDRANASRTYDDDWTR